MISVLFDDRQDVMEITNVNEAAIIKAIETVLTKEVQYGDFEVSVSFVTNEEIKELKEENKKLENKNGIGKLI